MKNNLNKRFLEKFYDLFEAEDDLITSENEAEFTQLKADIKSGINSSVRNRIKANSNIAPPVTNMKLWVRYAGVAAAMVLIGFSVFFFNNEPDSTEFAAKVDQQIKPGGNNAVLTLANGKQIILNDSQNGNIAAQGSVSIKKSAEGLITYLAGDHVERGSKAAEVAMNTISTPKGGQYKVVLPDGSQVQLNAESSLTFPAAFAAGLREVQLTGEAFFMVAKDAARPFRVISGSHSVEVLGTHFNVNAYSDEASIKTTLLEGAVRVSADNHNELLQPGQQSAAQKTGTMALTKRTVNVDKYVAWTNGYFSFANDDVKSVLRQIGRWYDVDIIYDGAVSGVFSGELFRSSKLSTVLNILEINGLHFEVRNKTITVSQIN
ncbi:MAG: FecR domain-containing protein [Bacteroidota bacterium]